MGFIKAFSGAVGTSFADQWTEFFHCDSLTDGELLKKGTYQNRRKNNHATENVISNGSKIVVNEGQFALVVEDGKVVDFCAEPGHFIWSTSSQPSLFCGGFGEGLKETFKTIGKRFAMGGEAGVDQRIYYINTKEIRDSKFGTPTPIPFALTDHEIGLKLYLDLSCYGTYSYKITDPLTFYQKVTGNVTNTFKREDIEPEIKPELLDALHPAFAQLASQRIGYEEISAHTPEIKSLLCENLKDFWLEARGIELQRINIISVSVQNKEVLDEFRKAQREYQSLKLISNPQLASAYALHAQGEAMKSAASNESGAINGFVGMGMMNYGGGSPIGQQALTHLSQAPQQPQPSHEWVCSCGFASSGKFCGECGSPKPSTDEWICTCGQNNHGKFCSDCGKPKLNIQEASWICNCGHFNEGKFCGNCGNKRPSES